MTILLDTHAALVSPSRCATQCPSKSCLEEAANRKLVSIASCWEIAIKSGLGKLRLAESAGRFLAAELPKNVSSCCPSRSHMPLRSRAYRLITETRLIGC